MHTFARLFFYSYDMIWLEEHQRSSFRFNSYSAQYVVVPLSRARVYFVVEPMPNKDMRAHTLKS